MFSDAFTKLEIDEIAEIIDYINLQTEGSIFDPLETTILAVNVSFYPEYRFLDIADHATYPPLQRFALNKGKEFILINWSYKPIYDLNESAPILLNDNNILDYVRFFFSYVKGRHGYFRIIESLEGIKWKSDLNIDIRRSYGQLISPMKVENKSDNNVYKINAIMMLKDTMFKVDVFIDSLGHVTLSEHEILIENMQVLDDNFNQ